MRKVTKELGEAKLQVAVWEHALAMTEKLKLQLYRSPTEVKLYDLIHQLS